MKRIIWNAVALMLVFLSTTAEARQYFIYGDKKKGTKFREVLYRSEIPLSKSYDKLTNKQKAVVLSAYPKLEAEDQPPFPKKGLIKILDPYVEEFRWYGETASGTLLIGVDEQGTIESISGDETMNDAVVRFMRFALNKVEFDPASCSGQPCSMVFKIDLKPIQNPKHEKNL